MAGTASKQDLFLEVLEIACDEEVCDVLIGHLHDEQRPLTIAVGSYRVTISGDGKGNASVSLRAGAPLVRELAEYFRAAYRGCVVQSPRRRHWWSREWVIPISRKTYGF